jgi:hypothetical protein
MALMVQESDTNGHLPTARGTPPVKARHWLGGVAMI